MPKAISSSTKEAILRDLFDPSKSLDVVIKTYKNVCSKRIIHNIGTEYGIDWELRTDLVKALVKRDQLEATILEMQNRLYDKVKEDDKEILLYRPPTYRPFRRPRER